MRKVLDSFDIHVDWKNFVNYGGIGRLVAENRENTARLFFFRLLVPQAASSHTRMDERFAECLRF
jgi:hypothetical protein